MGAKSHDLHIDALRSEMAMGYRPDGSIAGDIMPIVNVDKQSDLYVVFSRAARLRRVPTARSPGKQANLIDEPVGSASYRCLNYALKAAVTLEDRSNADPVFLDQIIDGRTRLVLDLLNIDWELRVANLVNSGSNVGSFSSVASAWTDGVNATPVGDINTVIDNAYDRTGKRPTDLVFGLTAWRLFRRSTEARNLIFGTNNGGGFVSRQATADLFEVDRIHVGEAFRNTGQELPDAGGVNAGETIAKIWDNNVLVSYRPTAPSREEPSFAYSFRWVRPGLPNMTVERHPFDSRTKSEEVEVGYYQDERITGSEYAFLLEDVNSST